VEIIRDDLSGPAIAAFLEAHVQQMREITPPESKHALDLDGLRRPEVTFWSMMDGDTVLGCGALQRLDAEHAELKSMRTSPAHRRQGIAARMLEHILAEATGMGLARISLETGADEFFAPARTLYRKYGFTPCEPFAEYVLDPLSVYLSRSL
jgi:putative acetyltransferase